MKLPRFSLRTLMVLIAVLCVPLGWVAHQIDWIRQRQAFLRSHDKWNYTKAAEWTYQVKAPWSLRLLGEQSFSGGYLLVTQSELPYARSLFPEVSFGVCGEQLPDR